MAAEAGAAGEAGETAGPEGPEGGADGADATGVTAGRVRVVADTTVCVGAGQCVLSEPEVFDQDESDGTVVVLAEQPGEAQLAGVREAVDVCPSQALSLTEE
jgi:ferredoxin